MIIQEHATPLILHGHFYQPPRENPLVNIIPKQSSAKPFSDWNERIYDDCYSTNAYSRFLNQYGQVERIFNNYEYISFNFGPTLLKWIRTYHPDLHERIIEADRESIKRLGFGNAMAQSFNHTILPLDTYQDARTQILWGVDDFTNRFGRAPQGMWLPEAAVNPSIVDLLSEAGIQFIVLSPWQCAQVETASGTWASTAADTVPYDTPFIIDGKNGGRVSAFFYHPRLASDISFGHVLRNADDIYRNLVHLKRDRHPRLIHTATDGEIYGHHEPFGDMALAALIEKVNTRGDFTFTNYASYLQQHPAVLRARLVPGEDKKGSSWSCYHGVSRWYKDCGCHTGGEEGWNQSWRNPLRTAFTLLAKKIDALYEREIKAMLGPQCDPWKILRSYSAVLSDSISVEKFIARISFDNPLEPLQKSQLAALLAGQKLKHFCFTSCGWFFSDLSGLEPKQNIRYALGALVLYQQFSDSDLLGPFLMDLNAAKSNKRHEGSGQTIAKNIMDGLSGISEASGYFLMNRGIARPSDFSDTYGKFHLKAFSFSSESQCSLDILDTEILRQYHTEAQISTPPNEGYMVNMQIHDDKGVLLDQRDFSSSHIPPRMVDEVFNWIDRSLSRISDEELQRIATDIRHYSLLVKNGRTTPGETLHVENMGTCLRALRSLFTTPDTLPWTTKRESISNLLEFIKRKGRQTEIAVVTHIFSQELDRVARFIMRTGLTYELGVYLLDVLEVVRSQSIQPSITFAQNAVYPYLHSEKVLTSTSMLKSLLDRLTVSLNFSQR